MLKKFFLPLLIITTIFLAISFGLVLAKNNNSENAINYEIPEKDGIYDVPNHLHLKVRVFVHNIKPEKPGKPLPPAPELQCGLNDLDSQEIVDWAGWKLPENFVYNLNPSGAPSLIGSENWQKIVENSFATWDNIVSKVTISRGADTNISRKALDGKNIVAWGTASASTLGITYVWYNTQTKEIVEADTILNKKFVWTWSSSSTCAYTNSYDAQNILTHEIGHWFGLDDEYDESYFYNTMYGYGFKMDAKGITLTTGDILGAKSIYQEN